LGAPGFGQMTSADHFHVAGKPASPIRLKVPFLIIVAMKTPRTGRLPCLYSHP
jgi:hypothetical protein